MSRAKRSSFFVDLVNQSCALSREVKEDRDLLVESIVHSSDLNNPVLKFEIYQTWANRVVLEFYQQAQAEKKLGTTSQLSNSLSLTLSNSL